MSLPDRERWKQMGPMLEEFLGLMPEERDARLAALRVGDLVLARDLEALLRSAAAADAARFLEGGAADAGTGSVRKRLNS